MKKEFVRMIFVEKPADLLLWCPKGQNRFLFQTENRTEAEAETCRVSHRFFFLVPWTSAKMVSRTIIMNSHLLTMLCLCC